MTRRKEYTLNTLIFRILFNSDPQLYYSALGENFQTKISKKLSKIEIIRFFRSLIVLNNL